jgi:hypothetical protein
MKNTFKALLAVLSVLVVMAACTKEPPLFFYKPGTTPGLTISDTSFALPASDSNAYRVKVKWTNPDFATDLSNAKFITQVDFAGRNFSNPLTSTVFGGFSDSFQNKLINKFILNNGVAFGAYANLEARVISSYGNNNDQKTTSAVPFRFRAYKVPPRVSLPSSGRLYLVGSASQGGWGNPVPTPTQEFSRIDETTWGGVFQLNGGAQYLALPVNGSWDNKYSVANSNLAGLAEGGDFDYNLSSNFPGPAADGLYTIIFDFQIGKFTVKPFTMQHGLPTQLVAVGGATPWGWNNSTDNPQRFSRLNSAEFQLASIALKANDGYLVLPVPGDWGKKYGVPNNTIDAARLQGDIKPEGSDFKSPKEAGNYRINFNFATGKYLLTKL